MATSPKICPIINFAVTPVVSIEFDTPPLDGQHIDYGPNGKVSANRFSPSTLTLIMATANVPT